MSLGASEQLRFFLIQQQILRVFTVVFTWTGLTLGKTLNLHFVNVSFYDYRINILFNYHFVFLLQLSEV